MRLSWGKIAIAVLVLVVSFGGAVWTMSLFSGLGSGQRLALVEVLSLKPDKPVCQLRAAITNQDGVILLEGECWTYTMRPAGG